MTPLVDCHSHTALSGHGTGTLADAVAAAGRAGVAVYAQTEHLTLPEALDPQHEDSMSLQDAAAYVAELLRQREELVQRGSGMQLIIGIEADWISGRGAELVELCAPYEYVLGSVHFIDGLPLDNSDNTALWEERGVDGVWRAYFDAWFAMAQSEAPIHCYAHPDLPKVFGDRPSFSLASVYDDMVGLVAEQGRMVEVNTAGWRKAVGEAYPAGELLTRFAQAGVPCTVGADAHKPADVAADVARAYKLMYECGYRQVAAPAPDGDRRTFEL